MEKNTAPIRILMVCLGNICRSPTAHGVIEKYIHDKGLSPLIEVDSAGTGDWHLGEAPDPRSSEAAARRGYDLSQQRSRQVQTADFHNFDYILAMDTTNLRDLEKLCPTNASASLHLFLEFGECSEESVPDPYYSGAQGFELVLDLVEQASENVLKQLVSIHSLTAKSGE